MLRRRWRRSRLSEKLKTREPEKQQETPASGSGFVISTDGYLVTNHHVIEHAVSVKAAFADGTIFTG